MAEIRCVVSQYSLNASGLPAGHIDEASFDVTVDRRVWPDGTLWWAICHGRWTLGRDGEWDLEGPDEREDPDWLRSHRWPALNDALYAARLAAPDIEFNGRAAKEVARGQ